MIVHQAQAAFLLLLLCLQQAAGISKSEMCTSPKIHDEKCGAYTYLLMKPILKKVEELKLDIYEKDNQLNFLNDATIALQSTIKFNKQQISTLQAESTTKDEHMQSKMDELMNAELKISTLESLVQNLKNHIVDLGKGFLEKNTEIKALHEQLNNTKRAVENSTNEHPNSCVLDGKSVQTINITPDKPIEVLCNNQWIVIQQRMDGSEDFERTFETYKNGFGELTGEFFIGLEKLHMITHNRPHELYIHLEDFSGNVKYAKYDQFEIGEESEDYTLEKLGEYSGTAGDSMRLSEDHPFFTYDKDNYRKCACKYSGAWWYSDHCGDSNLNGKYNKKNKKGTFWRTWKGYAHTYKFVQMRIRAKA